MRHRSDDHDELVQLGKRNQACQTNHSTWKTGSKSYAIHKATTLFHLPLEQEVCAICQDVKRDPVLLRCTHSYCRSCLQRFYQSCRRFAKRCPLCRCDMEPLQKQINWRLFLVVILAFCVLSIGPFYLLLTYW